MYEKAFFLLLCFRLLFAAAYMDEFVCVCVYYINNSYSINMSIFLFCQRPCSVWTGICHAYMYRTCPRNYIACDAELLRLTKSTAFVYRFVLHLYFFVVLATGPAFMCVFQNRIAYDTALLCLTKCTSLSKVAPCNCFFVCKVGVGPPIF